jgi:hypothetical protein
MTFIIVKGGHELIEVLQIKIVWNILFNTFAISRPSGGVILA